MTGLYQGRSYSVPWRGYHYSIDAVEWTDTGEEDIPAVFGIPLTNPFKVASKPCRGKEFAVFVNSRTDLVATVRGYNTATEVIVEMARFKAGTEQKVDGFLCLIEKALLLKVVGT